MFMSPKFSVETLPPSVMASGGGASGRSSGHEGGVSTVLCSLCCRSANRTHGSRLPKALVLRPSHRVVGFHTESWGHKHSELCPQLIDEGTKAQKGAGHTAQKGPSPDLSAGDTPPQARAVPTFSAHPAGITGSPQPGPQPSSDGSGCSWAAPYMLLL